MSFPTKEFERMVYDKEIIHDGDACLRWQMGCVIVERSATDDIKITKNRNKDNQKVDGLVASVMAVGQYLDWKGKQPKSAGSFKVVGLNF
jgi:phage terminase large subunit-like protein